MTIGVTGVTRVTAVLYRRLRCIFLIKNLFYKWLQWLHGYKYSLQHFRCNRPRLQGYKRGWKIVMNSSLIFNIIAVVVVGIAVNTAWRFPMQAVAMAYFAGLLTARASQYSLTIMPDRSEED